MSAAIWLSEDASQGGNYQAKLMRMIESGQIKFDAVQHVSVKHDDWCRIYTDGFCDCDPDIAVMK